MRFFYHFLATELGMTVRELLKRIGADEINDWRAYYQIRSEMQNRLYNPDGNQPDPDNFRKNFEDFISGANNSSR